MNAKKLKTATQARLLWLVLFLVLSIGAVGFLPTSGDPSTAPNAGANALVPTATPQTVSLRSIDSRDTWDLAEIYANDAAWEKDFKQIKDAYLAEYPKYEGKLGDAAQFAKLIEMDTQASRMMDKLYVYAGLLRDLDNTNSKASEMFDRASSLYNDLATAWAFIRPELLALDQKALEGYLKDPRFADDNLYLRYVLEDKPHTLSASEEKLISMAGDISGAPSTISTKIREADLVFPTVEDPDGNEIQLSEGVYGDLLDNPDRDFREQVYHEMLKTYGSMKNSLAASLDAQVRVDWYNARTHKYDSSLAAALGGNKIPAKVYASLLDATNTNLGSLHRYFTLRKKVMGLDQLRSYDLYGPLVQVKETKIPYKDAQAKLALALAPLGNQYVADLNKAFTSRWVDVYEQPHKTSGAYAWGTFDTHPYVLLNYNDSIDSFLDLGHEMGHAMNFFYSNKTQPYVKSGVATFNAEVASTTNEMLVLRYLVQNAKTDDEKLYYLNRLAENIRGTFYTQVMYAEFEEQIHSRVEEGDALSVDSLNEIWGDLLVKYYGDDYELTDDAKLGWSRIPHFFRDFYVYQYATGIAAADQFSLDLFQGKAGAADKYLAFLKAGGSDYPVSILQTAGVDMLSGKPVSTLLTDFNDTVSAMEKLLIKMGKIKP